MPRKAIKEAGRAGGKVVVLAPQDVATVRALANVGTDLLQKLGFNVGSQAVDWATLIQRRTKIDPPDQGGWSVYHTFWSGLDQFNPASNVFLRGNGRSAQPGWPTAPRLV